MTPINNNQMSEQELRKIISKIKCDDPYVGLDGGDVSKAIDELSTLISRERAEAVRGFVDFIVESNGIDDDYNITSLKRHLQEYLKTKEEV